MTCSVRSRARFASRPRELCDRQIISSTRAPLHVELPLWQEGDVAPRESGVADNIGAANGNGPGRRFEEAENLAHGVVLPAPFGPSRPSIPPGPIPRR